MNPQIIWELNPADPSTFSGTAHSTLLAAADSEAPVRLYYVRFEAGARTFWHTHSGPQILLVRSGRCRYQRAGGPVHEVGAGESVRFEAGERHWHGAPGDEGMEHIAVNLTVSETHWEEEVTEEDYRRPVGEPIDHTSAIFTSIPPS